MTFKFSKIMPLSAALASLQGISAMAAPVAANPVNDSEPGDAQPRPTVSAQNAFAKIGEDLFGFFVSTKADGAVVADHSSHASHSSHYSSR